MKTRILILSLLIIPVYVAAQQTISGKSQPKTVRFGQTGPTTTLRLMPDLIIVGERFTDANGNSIIDADETSNISFSIENIGKGEARSVKISVSQKEDTLAPHLSFTRSFTLGHIPANQKRDIVIPVTASMNLHDEFAKFLIEVTEERGLDAFPLEMTIETASFREPRIVVADAIFSTDDGGMVKLNFPIILKVLLQNVGRGDARDLRAEFIFPNPNCIMLGDTNVFATSKLSSGDTKEMDFLFTATRRYIEPSIPVRLRVSEVYGQFGTDTVFHVHLNQNLLARNQVVIEGSRSQNAEIRMASLVPETDRNIPVNDFKNPNRIALVIGNEDYSRYQRTLGSESNVAFARNDAIIFREYLIRTLGFLEENVYLITDGTTGEMLQKIDLVTRLVAKIGPEAELLFFYAGHGQPDEVTQIPYIIPVDVSATNLSAAIKLSDIYEKFSQTGARKITVFIDACFSGGGREAGLLAARAVRIRPRADMITGNMVVFSASTGEQSALPHTEKQHGLFTFHLLKKLQETAGNISYQELSDHLQRTVALDALRVNHKEQDPQTNVSMQVLDTWSAWRFIYPTETTQ